MVNTLEWFTKELEPISLVNMETTHICHTVNLLKKKKMEELIGKKTMSRGIDLWLHAFKKELIRRGESELY